MEKIICDDLAILIYTTGILLWFFLWKRMIGYKLLLKRRLLLIPFFGVIINLTFNVILSLYTVIPEYNTELGVYSYVESNAKTVSSLSLAIAIFVVLRFTNESAPITEDPDSKKFLLLIFWSFLFSIIGCLPLYWIPPVSGALTVLRHIKSVPYTYSLFTLASAIILFCYRVMEGKNYKHI